MVTLPLNLIWLMASTIGAAIVWLVRLEAQVRMQAKLHDDFREQVLEDVRWLRSQLTFVPTGSGSHHR